MTAVDVLLDRSSPVVREVFHAAAALVRDVMPGANEQVDVPDRLLAFGYGPLGGARPADFAIALIPHSKHVNVQLADGATLDDPTGIIEGTGKRIRHVKCRLVDDVGRPALRLVVAEQAARSRDCSEARG